MAGNRTLCRRRPAYAQPWPGCLSGNRGSQLSRRGQDRRVRDTTSGSSARRPLGLSEDGNHEPEPAGGSPRPGARLAASWGRYWYLVVLGCWTLAWFVHFARNGGMAWHFFTTGSTLLFDGAPNPRALPGGLHLYANYPQLQIGPVAFVITQGLRHLGPHQGVFATEAVLTAAGLYLIHALKRIALTVRPDLGQRPVALHVTFLAGGAVFLVSWTELTVTFAHLDDAVALILAVLAVRAATAGRPLLTGLCIGLATGSKPWALVFLPLLLMLPVRAWGRAAASMLAAIAVAGLPFAIADHNTVTALHYTIRNMPGSALRALGVSDPRTPSWDRPAQLLIGWVLAAAAVWRGRWPAVILLGVGARIALDPADWGYYTAGILLGALLWDVLGTRRPVPLWTVMSFAALTAVHAMTNDSALLGQLRLGLVIAFTAAILLAPAHAAPEPSSAAQLRLLVSHSTSRGMQMSIL